MKLAKNVFVLMFVFYCFSNISVADESDKKQEVQQIQQEKQTEEKPKQTKLEDTIKTPQQWCGYQSLFFVNSTTEYTNVYWFKVILAQVITNEYENMKKYFENKEKYLNYKDCISQNKIKYCSYYSDEAKKFKQDTKYEQLYKKVNEDNFNNLINFIYSEDFEVKELTELGYSIDAIPNKTSIFLNPIEKQITLNTLHQKKYLSYCPDEDDYYYDENKKNCPSSDYSYDKGYYYDKHNIESAKSYCEVDFEIGYKQNKSKVRLKYIVLRIKDTESESNAIIPLITEYGATKNLLPYMVVKDVSVKK